MITRILLAMLILNCARGRAVEDPCGTFLKISDLIKASPLPKELEVKIHYTGTIRLSNYGMGHRQIVQHETAISEYFPLPVMRKIVEFAVRRNQDCAEAVRLLVEVQRNYVFPIYEMGDPPDRVPTFDEALDIILIAERSNQTPEEFHPEFGRRMRRADEARTDYTHATISEVLREYLGRVIPAAI